VAKDRQARDGRRFSGRGVARDGRAEEIEVVEAWAKESSAGIAGPTRVGPKRPRPRAEPDSGREVVMQAWLLLAKRQMAAWWSVFVCLFMWEGGGVEKKDEEQRERESRSFLYGKQLLAGGVQRLSGLSTADPSRERWSRRVFSFLKFGQKLLGWRQKRKRVAGGLQSFSPQRLNSIELVSSV